MFRYDSDYTEATHQYEADAAELAMLDADRRDMQEYPAPLSALEAAESKRYLAWGSDFADDAGPIGMNGAISQTQREQREAA